MAKTEDRAELERVAYHEAGHTVMAWTFGLEIGEVSIVPDDDRSGVVKLLSWDEFDEPLLRAHALTDLAGEVTEEIRTGIPTDWGEFLSTPGADIYSFTDVALSLGWFEVDSDGTSNITGYMDTATEEVRGLLKERWSAVEAVAHALLDKGTLSGGEAVTLMASVPGPGPIAGVWTDVLEERRLEAEFREALLRKQENR